jgi:hypothetical protein
MERTTMSCLKVDLVVLRILEEQVMAVADLSSFMKVLIPFHFLPVLMTMVLKWTVIYDKTV